MRLEMLERGGHSSKPFNSELASIIDDVKLMDSRNQGWLAGALNPWFNDYADSMIHHLGMKPDAFPSFHLKNAWINYQKANEPNPEHVHSSDISFSVYLQIPESLKQEHQQYTGRSAGPGGITFRYGEVANMTRTQHTFFPEEGDIIIFPSTLAHWVNPFKSDCVRISLAGNLYVRAE